MMHSMMRLAMLATSATVLGTIPGCDPGEGERDDALDELEFRCAVLGGCEDQGGNGTLTGPKGNTSFLGEVEGEGVYPLNELPLVPGTTGPVALLEIHATRCHDGIGEIKGDFVSVLPTLTMGSKGELGPLTMVDPATGMPCQITGDLWSNTRWRIEYGQGAASFQTDLWLTEVNSFEDADGAPLYEFWVDTTSVPDPRYRLFPTCEADADEDQALQFAAYLVPGLSVDPSSGDFAASPNHAYLACLSGSVGKAWRWGYKSFLPAIDSEGHEVAHNAIRADYCADGSPYTQPGTPVWFQSVFTEEGPDPSAPPAESTWELEAVWPADPHAPAICVGTTRRPEHLPAPEAPFPCQEGGTEAFDIPRCTEAHLTHPDAVIATWAQTDLSLVPPQP